MQEAFAALDLKRMFEALHSVTAETLEDQKKEFLINHSDLRELCVVK